MTEEWYQTQFPEYQLLTPKQSNWTCYMFGGTPGYGLAYTPQEGRVPNRFVRWMMKICFDCNWVKTND